MVFWKRANSKEYGDIRSTPPSSGERPKLRAAFTEELQASVRHLNDNTKKRSIKGFRLRSPKKDTKKRISIRKEGMEDEGDDKPSPFGSGSKVKLTKDKAEELRRSFRDLNKKEDGHEVVPSKEPKVEEAPLVIDNRDHAAKGSETVQQVESAKESSDQIGSAREAVEENEPTGKESSKQVKRAKESVGRVEPEYKEPMAKESSKQVQRAKESVGQVEPDYTTTEQAETTIETSKQKDLPGETSEQAVPTDTTVEQAAPTVATVEQVEPPTGTVKKAESTAEIVEKAEPTPESVEQSQPKKESAQNPENNEEQLDLFSLKDDDFASDAFPSDHWPEDRTSDHRQASRRTLSKELTLELGESFRIRSGRMETLRQPRPSISKDVAFELRQSFRKKDERTTDRRQEIKDRLIQRRESERTSLGKVPEAPRESTESAGEAFGEAVPKEPTSLGAFVGKGKPARPKKGKLGQSQHSADTFDASFSDDDESVFTWRRETAQGTKKQTSSTPRKGTKADFQSGGRQVVEEDDIGDSNDQDSLGTTEQSSVKKENKKPDEELSMSTKKIALLEEQLGDLRTETTDLRKQLSNWQEKASQLSSQQTKERLKSDSSSDVLAQTRADLTNALNETSTSKAKIHELELVGDDNRRRMLTLNETVRNQSQKIDDLNVRLKDTEAELRHNVEDKRRVEEELSVLVASRDGSDVSEAIQQLEQDKAKWLEEKELALEAKRIALDEESDRVMERERKQQQQESDRIEKASEKAKKFEAEHLRLQKNIDKQLQEMKESNQELQERIQTHHMDSQVEMKEKDHSIAKLEQEISKVRRLLAASQLREQENERRLAQMDSVEEELRGAREKNEELELEVTRLLEELKNRKSDWKEVILPGYRNLRGVTFGAPSEELAGFLTILVEDQKAQQGDRKSQEQKEVSKYLKEPKSKEKAKAASKDRKSKPKAIVKTTKSKKLATKKAATKKGIVKKKSSAAPSTKKKKTAKKGVKGRKKVASATTKEEGKTTKKKKAKGKGATTKKSDSVKKKATAVKDKASEKVKKTGKSKETKGEKKDSGTGKKQPTVKKKKISTSKVAEKKAVGKRESLKSKKGQRIKDDNTSLIVVKRNHGPKKSKLKKHASPSGFVPPRHIILQ